jgi:hypothetical protein
MHLGFCTEYRDRPRFGVVRIIAFTIGGVALAILFAFLFGWLVQALWNWLMPCLFNLKAISYWQAFGLVVLAKILFGCHPGAGRHHRAWRHHRRHWKECDSGDDWKTEDAWKPHGSYRNWKYYDKYWREEGKVAFEAYIDKLEKEGKSA